MLTTVWEALLLASILSSTLVAQALFLLLFGLRLLLPVPKPKLR